MLRIESPGFSRFNAYWIECPIHSIARRGSCYAGGKEIVGHFLCSG